MVFTPPFTAVPGEKITSAGHNTSVRDNLNHIWGVIGGNPGTNNRVPVSSGASASVWSKLPDAALADPKISQTNPVITDASAAMMTGIFNEEAPAAGAPSNAQWYIVNYRYWNLGIHYAFQWAMHVLSPLTYVRVIMAGTPGPWYRVWNAAGMGNGSGLDADTLRTLIPGNAAGNLAVNNGTVNASLNAALLSGLSSGNGSGQIPVSNGVLNTNLNAQLHAGLTAGNAAGNIPVSNGVLNASLNAALLSGLAAGNAAGNIPVSNTILNTGLNAQYLNGVQSSGFAPATSTFQASSVGNTVIPTSYQPICSITINVSGFYIIIASADAFLDALDSSVIGYIRAGGTNISNVMQIGHLEGGSRPWTCVARYTAVASVVVDLGGQKGAGAGGTTFQDGRIIAFRVS